jgi:hypothetical protein
MCAYIRAVIELLFEQGKSSIATKKQQQRIKYLVGVDYEEKGNN